ncbi:prepilin-type N-terminal cleavage/methylation domain-containing protein [Chromohalobacter sp. TMW 2.2308]|uniref:PilW family protein n=1 Tax=Chromohalobacter TaxID=42054 RepID=UPI001FFCF774|nr:MULTISPECIES: prepilin-type N-terminal cleavage/methylation domain-containing protein [Chromohalobacter]MCK2044221.1 prepilin-type N-terminal cleavage/methylation domain-containing protein [Chromohalobacter moromii]MCT8516302.1 prepilin-type N-terminal cleavage/methylation domain-containing protein [Chromohalobacter sp. TMW 2.2271]
MSHQHRQRGFTLIEMMISMFLGLIILGGTITAYQAISSVSEQRDNNYKLQDELMYIHRELSSSVKVAKSISIENNDEGSKLILESYSGEDINKIRCPGADDGSGRIEWITDVDDKWLTCNDQEVMALAAPGITSVRFGDEGDSVCDDAASPCVRVTLKYKPCREEDECDVKTLSFHLASRATSDSDGDP